MANKFINRLGSPLTEWNIKYRVPATQRMFERSIDETDILNLLQKGNIIEEYHDDYPFSSVLVNGTNGEDRPLHVVVSIDFGSKRLYLITTYEPDSNKWTDNFSRRFKP